MLLKGIGLGRVAYYRVAYYSLRESTDHRKKFGRNNKILILKGIGLGGDFSKSVGQQK